MAEPIHSTGRGGAGNIGKDENVYTDGAIVREGIEGESADGEYSTGRGGAGNIGAGDSPAPEHHMQHQHHKTQAGHRTDDVVVPELAVKPANNYPDYHTGRGGQGNVHKDKFGGHSSAHEQGSEQEGRRSSNVGEKIKHALHLG